MAYKNSLRQIARRYPFVGPLLWCLSVQCFVAQAIVAEAWSTAYSLTGNTISDLGAATCGLIGTAYVCSPLHRLVNLSFVVFGLTSIGGSLLMTQQLPRSHRTNVGLTFMVITGLASVVVGLCPEDVRGQLHLIGAVSALMFSNLSILILARTVSDNLLRRYSLATGAIGLSAFLLFALRIDLGIGNGGIERVASYTPPVWLLVFGIYRLRNNSDRTTVLPTNQIPSLDSETNS